MDTHSLESQLNQLWASVIEGFSVDLCAHTISMDIRTKQDDNVEYRVVFGGVSSFYFVGGESDERFNRPPWDYAELSEVYFYSQDVHRISHRFAQKPGFAQYGSSANFVLEMWSSCLFVEASSVVINDSRFDVGYPRISVE